MNPYEDQSRTNPPSAIHRSTAPADSDPRCPHSGVPLERPAAAALDQFGLSPATGAHHYLNARSLDYDDDYFLSEYREQYGKTYVEDEPNLRRLARRRLGLLPEITGSDADGPRLFEIGCACGFFLDEAREAGYRVAGLEISPYAVNFARETLELDVTNASFLEVERTPPGPFDVVAAFFVLEHFQDQAAAFARVADLLKPGGLFLFALPSTRGPLFEYTPEEWASTHPVDHFADYDPRSIRRTLALYGMRLIRKRPMSYHPRRARGWRGSALLRPAYRLFADLQCFGDTMEGLAIKDK